MDFFVASGCVRRTAATRSFGFMPGEATESRMVASWLLSVTGSLQVSRRASLLPDLKRHTSLVGLRAPSPLIGANHRFITRPQCSEAFPQHRRRKRDRLSPTARAISRLSSIRHAPNLQPISRHPVDAEGTDCGQESERDKRRIASRLALRRSGAGPVALFSVIRPIS